jgi:hypothetical protein
MNAAALLIHKSRFVFPAKTRGKISSIFDLTTDICTWCTKKRSIYYLYRLFQRKNFIFHVSFSSFSFYVFIQFYYQLHIIILTFSLLLFGNFCAREKERKACTQLAPASILNGCLTSVIVRFCVWRYCCSSKSIT